MVIHEISSKIVTIHLVGIIHDHFAAIHLMIRMKLISSTFAFANYLYPTFDPETHTWPLTPDSHKSTFTKEEGLDRVPREFMIQLQSITRHSVEQKHNQHR